MYNDLAHMAKAKGIYRTLALCAILSHKPAASETVKYPLKIHVRQGNKQVNVGEIGAKEECLAL